MNTIVKKLPSALRFAAVAVAPLLILAGVAYAGSLTAPSGTPEATSYTLEDIYQKLTADTDATEADHDLTTASAPSETMHTLADIYDAAVDAMAASAAAAPLKTGQITCWDSYGVQIEDCTGTNQDGELQRGVARSYTDNRNGTVTDNATGLMWVKDPEQIIPWLSDEGIWATATGYVAGDLVNDPDDCAGAGCTFWVAQTAHTSGDTTFADDRAANPTYWTQTLWVANDEGVYPLGMTWSNALTNCANLNYASYTNWHLPNRNELLSLVDLSTVDPAINSTYFPNAQSANYWSATTYQFPGDENFAWYVDFFDGSTDADYKSNSFYVRCAR